MLLACPPHSGLPCAGAVVRLTIISRIASLKFVGMRHDRCPSVFTGFTYQLSLQHVYGCVRVCAGVAFPLQR